jgi:hypothetical protein
MANTTAVPNLLTDPGFIFWAPLGSTLPAGGAAGSVYTDAWPVAWVNLGATESGSDFDYSVKVAPVTVAEFLDPIKYMTTDRSGSIAFNMADYTLNNLKRAYNGGTLTAVSGTGATLSSTLIPPAVGAEVRAMIGWESLDASVRIIFYQCLNSGSVKQSFNKAPKFATIPCMFQMEIPLGQAFPFKVYAAGTTRLGS